ncbi:related to Hgl1p, required for dimorphism and teliospore formation [Ustilago trichophora]|uniref:Related to Hgl1p, required for dimorphism and teliospore formation n=1 Tax=Ustilago trichophora TaxID=86804 RepID=A0A5C3DPU0_9BASI|nr:related to Hgl1p, required for dimorphism and teliospore formation [Ustilago trichophora]
MSVATRRASLTPSSPAVSRRGSWVDVPVGSAPSSRRGSRVDLSINTSIANSSSTSDSHAGSSHAKLAINQLLTNLSHVSEAQARMSSPKGSLSPALSESHGAKRKYEADADSAAYKVASAAEIQLPTDPLRRASIINLATAAAAAVLQSQAGQRRLSTYPEQEQKRQRVEQLGMLIEQARKASVGSMSHDMSRHVETASQNVAIATVLANHLGLTPQSSAASTPSAGTPAPSSPTKTHASTLAVPVTPTTPKSPLSSAPLTATHEADEPNTAQDAASTPARAADDEDDEMSATRLHQASSPTSPTSTPAITLNASAAVEPSSSSSSKLPEWRSSEGIFDEAKQAAHTYSRFYRFEKEWAQKALELERRRSSVRIDPLFNPNPTLSPQTAEVGDDKMRGPESPQQHSAPESRVMSRGTSPFGDFLGGPLARTAHSVPSGSFSSSHRGSSSSLANVLSNFAELIEHRQRSCSGLEALAKQAKELPMKRLSQPNPQFRTTFGDFSWARKPSISRPIPASKTIDEADADDSQASSPSRDELPNNGESASASKSAAATGAGRATPSSHLQVKSEKKIKKEEAADSDGDAPATPRSTMSIASML